MNLGMEIVINGSYFDKIMSEEFLAEVDTDDNVVAIHPRSVLNEKNFRIRIAVVVPRGPHGTFLFSRRAKHKFPFPNTWMFAIGGKVRADESYEEAALREMKEEVGCLGELEYVGTSKLDLPAERAIVKIYTTCDEFTIDTFEIDRGEIAHIEAFSLQDMSRIIDQTPDECAPTFRKHFEVFYSEMRRK